MNKRSRRLLVSTPAAFLAVALLLAGWMWLTDFITVQGERTIYTVACQGGEWRGDLCTGKLGASVDDEEDEEDLRPSRPVPQLRELPPPPRKDPTTMF